MLKRKPAITPEQFRDHYEKSHAVLAHNYLGHLLLEYKRCYNAGTWGGGAPTEPAGSFGPMKWEYDCVTEWVTPDEAAFNEIIRLAADPVIGKIFYDDEENFLDRASMILFKCDERNTGTGDGAETLKLRGRI